MADKKKTADELLEEGKAKIEQAKQIAKGEAEEIWSDILPTLRKLKAKLEEFEIVEDFKEFVQDKKADFDTLKEMIEERQAAEDKATSGGGTGKKFTPEQLRQRKVKQGFIDNGDKETIIKILQAYDAAPNKSKFMADYVHDGEPLPLNANNIKRWKEHIGWHLT